MSLLSWPHSQYCSSFELLVNNTQGAVISNKSHQQAVLLRIWKVLNSFSWNTLPVPVLFIQKITLNPFYIKIQRYSDTTSGVWFCWIETFCYFKQVSFQSQLSLFPDPLAAVHQPSSHTISPWRLHHCPLTFPLGSALRQSHTSVRASQAGAPSRAHVRIRILCSSISETRWNSACRTVVYQ